MEYFAPKGVTQPNDDISPAPFPGNLSEDVAVFQHHSSLLTPKQKLVHTAAADQALLSSSSASSCCSSSDMPVKEGFESSLLSPEFDSESYSSSPDGHRKLAFSRLKMVDCTSKLRDDRECEMVLNSIMDLEHEINVSNKKIQFSEEEIHGLKYELETNDAVVKLIVFLKLQLDSAESEVKLHKVDLEMDKRKTKELQNQVSLLESQMTSSDYKIEIGN